MHGMEQPSSLDVRVFGLVAQLTVQPDRAEEIAQQWSWCALDSASQRTIAPIAGSGVEIQNDPDSPAAQAPIVVERPDESTVGDSPNLADYRLTTTLTSTAIAARRAQYVMLHAGGIANADGRVAALIAASGTGKTTATRHLCTHEGYAYVTDETVIFNDHGEVLPYPKPLSVIPPDTHDGSKRQYSPTQLGFAPPPEGTLQVGPFILLDRVRDDAVANDAGDAGDVNDTPAPDAADDAPALHGVDLLEGLAVLLPQSSSLPSIPGSLGLLARIVTECGGILELRYREIHETAELIERAFNAAPSTQEWKHYPGNWDELLPDQSPYDTIQVSQEMLAIDLEGEAVLTHGPFVDALSVDNDERILLLHGNNPTMLDGIGALTWMLAGDGVTLDELERACVERFGAHPQARQMVASTADQMRQHGVLYVQER